jgi:hypothetical protein
MYTMRRAICSAASSRENRRKPPFLIGFEIKMQKGVDLDQHPA